MFVYLLCHRSLCATQSLQSNCHHFASNIFCSSIKSFLHNKSVSKQNLLKTLRKSEKVIQRAQIISISWASIGVVPSPTEYVYIVVVTRFVWRIWQPHRTKFVHIRNHKNKQAIQIATRHSIKSQTRAIWSDQSDPEK